MSELPAYRSSPIGMPRNRPFTRPTEDSLPKHECSVPGCGTGNLALEPGVLYLRVSVEDGRLFCSWGCLGRYAARMELRS